jgi:glucose-6-phosphate dehydrogenase assembly protein OpcA
MVASGAGSEMTGSDVSADVWSEHATDPDAIEAALRELLHERHVADRALAPARVLNLIVVVDRERKEEISKRLDRVGRYHASRTILCSVEPGRQGLDAVAVIAYDDGGDGALRPVRERVEIDLGPDQLSRIDTIADPILVSELPTMLWSPDGHDEAVEALLPLTDVILVDSDPHPTQRGLARAAQLSESAYVVDLAWLRTTPWRERLASSFDLPERRDALGELTQLWIRHRSDSLASATLLAGWMATRLEWETEPFQLRSVDGYRGTARAELGEREVEIALVPVDQEVPGLAGVTVGWCEGCSLSLDRAPGGLRARERHPGGAEQSWQVLGASRGEGGILGEGVRQALLRDTTYGPALDQGLVLRGRKRSG